MPEFCSSSWYKPSHTIPDQMFTCDFQVPFSAVVWSVLLGESDVALRPWYLAFAPSLARWFCVTHRAWVIHSPCTWKARVFG